MNRIMLYNSLSRSEEVFTPQSDEVQMYVCGPTVYDTPHLGNIRPAIVFDVLHQFLARTWRVNYIRNLTDIDDKIIERAAERGVPIEQITYPAAQAYHRALRALWVEKPKWEPRATHHIPDMIEMIQTLVSKGHAYESEGHVLFRLSSHPNHGELSRHEQADLRATGRVADADYKEAQGDFVLWKPSSESQPGWASPWGRGRPGWHIECSAMIKARASSPTIDIHGGGSDLRFPHHDCEMSQSLCANGHPLARFWMHNGMLLVNGKKMSKSLGNFVTVQELLRKGIEPAVIRMVMLQTHYRQPLNWTQDAVDQAQSTVNKFREYIAGSSNSFSNLLKLNHGEMSLRYRDESINNSLAADLNTPDALTRLHAAMAKKRTGADIEDLIVREGLHELGFGAFMRDARRPMNHAEETIFNRRNVARATKDFATADRLRDQLAAARIVVMDTPEKTIWWRQ